MKSERKDLKRNSTWTYRNMVHKGTNLVSLSDDVTGKNLSFPSTLGKFFQIRPSQEKKGGLGNRETETFTGRGYVDPRVSSESWCQVCTIKLCDRELQGLSSYKRLPNLFDIEFAVQPVVWREEGVVLPFHP